LIDCVEGGASVSFMPPLSRERAITYWRHIAEGVAAGRRALLVAEDSRGICGTVQLVLDLPENQPHRADLVKMLVHRRARRRGVGSSLMRGAEAAALECGRTLLVLDAVTGGDGFRLYERLGWIRVGDIPRFALMPDGRPCSTTYFYRDLTEGVSEDSAGHTAFVASHSSAQLSGCDDATRPPTSPNPRPPGART
jgi:GNAT superfamily N-acetyltransferase